VYHKCIQYVFVHPNILFVTVVDEENMTKMRWSTQLQEKVRLGMYVRGGKCNSSTEL